MQLFLPKTTRPIFVVAALAISSPAANAQIQTVLKACTGQSNISPWMYCDEAPFLQVPLATYARGVGASQSHLVGANDSMTSAYARLEFRETVGEIKGPTFHASALTFGDSFAGQVGTLGASVTATATASVSDRFRLFLPTAADGTPVSVIFFAPKVNGNTTGEGTGWRSQFTFSFFTHPGGGQSYDHSESNSSGQGGITLSDTGDYHFNFRSGNLIQISSGIGISASSQVDNFTPGTASVAKHSNATADFSNTVVWGGIRSVANADTGEAYQWSYSSDSGIRWDMPGADPIFPS